MKLSEKEIHIGRFFQEAKSRAQNKNVPFNITLKYLREVAGDHCPVFGHKFVWGRSKLGKGKTTGDSPSLDRIVPELGYVPGNVVFISHNANRIKNDATEKELYAVADWLHEARKKVNVNERPTAPVSEGTDSQSEHDAKRRAVFAARLGEDRNDTDNHSGTIPGQDADHSTQESSGDSVGHGVQEMEALIIAQSIEATWPGEPKVIFIRSRGRRIPD
jgi:hypothetical protein